jgi:hypothetical protein
VQKLATRREAMDEVIDWLRFYNHSQLHSTLRYIRLMKFDEIYSPAKELMAA